MSKRGANSRLITVTERKGVNAVEKALLDYEWLVREQFVSDYGVDLQVETAQADGSASGRLLALQVKAGPSFFKEMTADAVVFRPKPDHVAYWRKHSLPVLIVLFNTEDGELVWQWTNAAVSTGKGFRIDIPRGQRLDQASLEILRAAAEAGAAPMQAADIPALAKSVGEAKPDKSQPSAVVALAPSRTDLIKAVTHMSVAVDGLSATALSQIARLLDERIPPPAARPAGAEAANAGAGRDAEDPALHARIDQAREVRTGGDPAVALKLFRGLIAKIDAKITPNAWFRAITNLGGAALEIGDEPTAIDAFDQAYAADPASPVAMANMALSHHLQRRHQDAFDLAQSALVADGAMAFVVTVLLHAAARLDWTGDPATLIPAALANTNDARLALIEFYRIREDPRWIDDAIAAARDAPDDRVLARMGAYAVLELIAMEPQFVPGGQGRATLEQFREAGATLEAEVNHRIAERYADMSDLADEATNAAIAYRIAGEYQKGVDLLERVWGVTGGTDHIFRMLGLLHSLNGQPDRALEILEQAPDDGEAQMIRAEIIGQTDAAAGLAILLKMPDKIVPAEHKVSRWLVAAGMAMRAKDDGAFRKAVTAVRKSKAYAPYAAVLEIQHRPGQSGEDATEALATVAAGLDAETPFVVRMAVANALAAHDAMLAASRVLDGQVDMSRDSDAARMRLRLLAASGRDEEFLAAYREMPQTGRDDQELVWLHATHAFNRGDLPVAEKDLRRLHELEPGELRPALLLLETLIRRGRDAAVRSMLAQDLETLAGATLADRLRLGRIYCGFGQFARGLKLLYRLLLENRDQPEVWVTFGALVLESGRRKAARLEANAVGDDIAVTLALTDGTTLDFIVEPDPELRKLDDTAREPEHGDVQATWGLAEGASVVLPDGRKAEIRALRHKYVARGQDVLSRFQARFPKADGFRSIAPGARVEDTIEALKALLQERADFVEAEADDYEAGDLPLAITAYRLGLSTIDTADGLAQTGRKFHVANGDEAERLRASNSLYETAGKGAVVDAQTFWTIWSLGAADVVRAAVGPLHYTAHALSVLQARLERYGPEEGDGYLSAAMVGGQLSTTEVTGVQLRAATKSLKAAILWLDGNGVLTPAHLPADLPDELRPLLLDFKLPIFDEVLIARGQGLLLLVDDQRLRKMAHGLGVQHSSWLHWTLGYAVDAGEATLDQYIDWSAQLLARGQTYIGLSAGSFLRALDRDHENGLRVPGETFKVLITCLGGKSADPRSHIRVALQIFHRLWNNSNFTAVREAATGLILERLIHERRGDYRPILDAVRTITNHPWVKAYVDDWANGHFLGPIDEG